MHRFPILRECPAEADRIDRIQTGNCGTSASKGRIRQQLREGHCGTLLGLTARTLTNSHTYDAASNRLSLTDRGRYQGAEGNMLGGFAARHDLTERKPAEAKQRADDGPAQYGATPIAA